MPDRLSVRSTLLLAALAFGLTFAIQALFDGSSSAAKPAAKRSTPALVASAPAAAPDLSLATAGTVPALREPRKPRPVARKKKRKAPKVVDTAPEVVSPVTPVATVSPSPTGTPRFVPPAPRRSTPAPKPKPKPTPAATPTPQTSGEFDSSGEP